MEPEERRKEIVRRVLLHGVVTQDWIYPELYSGLSAFSADKDLQKMRGDGLLTSASASDRITYYLPTEKLCRAHGVHHWVGKECGTKSLARRVGVAAYCHRHGLRRLTSAEFKAEFPELHEGRGWACGSYYVANDLLGWVEVDANTRKDPKRFIKDVEEMFHKRRRRECWRGILARDLFHVVIVTPSEGKKAVLKQALGKPRDLINIQVVPELQGVLLREES